MSCDSRSEVSRSLGRDFHEGYVIIPFVLAGNAVWFLSMIGHKGLEVHEKTRPPT